MENRLAEPLENWQSATVARSADVEAAGLRRRLGANVRRARAEQGLSQLDLARLIGIHDARISDIERGRTDVRLSTLGKLARALGVKLGELCC